MIHAADPPIDTRPQGWPYGFRSGDITRLETAQGPMCMQILQLGDPNFLEIRWEWPSAPEASL